MALVAIENLSNELNDTLSTANPLTFDEVYSTFCSIIDNNLDTKVLNRNKHSRPWWNKDLASLAKEVRSALKKWECDKLNKSTKLIYLSKQKEFSKLV